MNANRLSDPCQQKPVEYYDGIALMAEQVEEMAFSGLVAANRNQVARDMSNGNFMGA